MIKCLPKEVQGKLRSGVALPSLQQCVEELLLNSIDAQATCVGVRMDMEAFKVQVIDNGAGIDGEDMERVGNRYYTSKCSSVDDLDALRWYGFRGEALASLSSLATLVEISSRTRSSVKTHVKIFKDGKGMSVFEADTARPSAGTTVVICNFFHNMPVRRKRMDAVLEGERIRQRVEAISLMHPTVSFTLKNDCTGAMMVQLPKARNTYHRFAQIHGLTRAQKLGEIGHSCGQFEVNGYIGREGHYNNSLQFLYVNDRLLLKTRIHKLLNFLLRRLSSSNQKSDSPDGQSAIRSPKHKRSQELHAVYIINIKCSYSGYDICLEPAKTLIEFKDWDGILLCIEEAVKAFLRKENLVAVFSQDDLDCVSPKLFGTDDADQAASTSSTLDCGIGMKLTSDAVHRKREENFLREDNVCQESAPMESKEKTEGLKDITANELEKVKSEGDNQCSDEPLCDPLEQEPASDSILTEEEELTFSEAGEASLVLSTPSSVTKLETEKNEFSKETVEIGLNNTTSTSNGPSLDSSAQPIQPELISIKQILLDCQATGGHEKTSVSKKISLSNPYIHGSLQTKDPSQTNKLVFQQEIIPKKCEERIFAPKRKISLDAGHNEFSQKICNDSSSFTTSKIPRIITCQKLSLCKEPGSLEKFRRVFVKPDVLKVPSQEVNTKVSQTDSFILNSQNLLVCQKDCKDSNVTETGKEEIPNPQQSPLPIPLFTKLKPILRQNKSKTSLAAKLCHLKQHRTVDTKVLPQLSRPTSLDSACPSAGDDGIQDSNNNENPVDDTPIPELAAGCSANPQLAEGGEEAVTSGDWLHHYDTSVGKTVYINKVTGLSRYEEPSTEEAQVRCTSDVTNMAVSVISEQGEWADFPVLQQ